MRSLEWQIDVNGLARKPIRHTLPLFASNSITRETSQVCLRQLISTNENFGNNKVFLFRIIKSNPIFPIITCRKNNESGRYYRPKLKICKPSTVNAGLISLLLDLSWCSSVQFLAFQSFNPITDDKVLAIYPTNTFIFCMRTKVCGLVGNYFETYG